MDTSFISVVAPKYGLPVDLVAAIVKHESSGNRFAHRIEPAYRWLWNVAAGEPYRCTELIASDRLPPADFHGPEGISAETEWLDQQSGWGLMQVMGAVAREQGFEGPLPGLCDPLEGLHHGCQLLKRRADRYLKSHGWAGVVAAYNAGSPVIAADGHFENQAYVDAVAAAGAGALLA